MQDNVKNRKVALLIIYNHRYDKNIPLLETIYGERFTYLYHIIPFYDGAKDNVITVYDSSFYFESYIAQAYQHIKNKGFTHYFFIADDMILNPQINENSLFEFTGIPENCCWINDFRDYTTHPYNVPVCIQTKKRGIEVNHFLPPVDGICKKIKTFSLKAFPNRRYVVFDLFNSLFKRRLSWVIRDLYYLIHFNKKNYYPGVWGYSDAVLLPADYMANFALYCGALGGLNVFVEHAIPLALIMSSDKILLQKNIKLNTITQLYGLGEKGQKEFLDKYNYSLEKLLANFPKDCFFVHPIKLSKWK